jgi:hypothetical protein
MKALFTFFLILLLGGFAFGQSDDPRPGPLDEWLNLGLEAEWATKPVNYRAGYYLTNNGDGRLFIKMGLLLAESDLFQVRLYPFWLNWDLTEQAYNTPITLETLFLDTKYWKAGVDLSLYERQYAVNVFAYFRIFTDIRDE